MRTGVPLGGRKLGLMAEVCDVVDYARLLARAGFLLRSTSAGRAFAGVFPLQDAQRDRIKLSLLLEGNDGQITATTHVEQVGGHELIISQPVVGGRTQPLATGEDLQVGFVLDSVFHKGHARCLGRTRIAAGVAVRERPAGDWVVLTGRHN